MTAALTTILRASLALSLAGSGLVLAQVAAPAGAEGQVADTAPASAAEPLPEASDLLKRAFEARGGERLSQVENVTQSGTLTLAAQGITGKIRTWIARPNRMLTEIELPPIGKIRQGFDGEVGWAVDPMQGPRLLSGDELEMFKLQGDIDSDLADLAKESETLGSADFEGQDTWKVRIVLANGQEMTTYFAKDSGLMVGMSWSASTPYGKIPQTTSLSYERLNGILVPTRVVSKQMGVETQLTFDETRFNVDDLPSFAPPEDIVALQREAAGH